MSRTVLIKPEEEHPYPICEGWRRLVQSDSVSYEWFVCGCSPCERTYQIKIGERWEHIKNCPFCGTQINPWWKDWHSKTEIVACSIDNDAI